ncbi:hypothetical protein ACIOVC_04970 [Pseudomonas neuropathica]|jgi:hypothetical protein
MRDLSTALPEALRVKEAKEGFISMKDIPNGPTAIIPKQPIEDDGDGIHILVGNMKTDYIELGPVVDRVYEFTLPREWLIDFAGSSEPLVFQYTYFAGGINEIISEKTLYRILH